MFYRMHARVDDDSRHLQVGDVVIKMCGKVNTAMLIAAPEPATICIATLATIRIVAPSRLAPEYLEWFINSAATQTTFAKHTQFGRKRVLTADHLRRLNVVLPSIERQRPCSRLRENRAMRAHRRRQAGD